MRLRLSINKIAGRREVESSVGGGAARYNLPTRADRPAGPGAGTGIARGARVRGGT